MTKATIARCRALLQQIDREELYEDDTDDDDNRILKQEVIAERLTVLLGCVDIGPTSIEPKGFVLMLLTHIDDVGIEYLALESGCREIEANKKKIHSVAEVLEVLKAHQEQWGTRCWAIRDIENIAHRLQADIEEAQRLLEREQERTKGRQAARAFTEQLFHLRRLAREITAKQDAARETYQEIERAMSTRPLPHCAKLNWRSSIHVRPATTSTTMRSGMDKGERLSSTSVSRNSGISHRGHPRNVDPPTEARRARIGARVRARILDENKIGRKIPGEIVGFRPWSNRRSPSSIQARTCRHRRGSLGHMGSIGGWRSCASIPSPTPAASNSSPKPVRQSTALRRWPSALMPTAK